MAAIWQKIKNWIVKIQNSDESIKRRYLTIFTIITMMVIVGLWFIYMKLLTPSFGQINQPEVNSESETQFWQVFKNGLNIVTGGIKENIQNITSQIFKGNTINIK